MRKNKILITLVLMIALVAVFCVPMFANGDEGGVETKIVEILNHYFAYRENDYLNNDSQTMVDTNNYYSEQMLEAIKSRTQATAVYVDGIESIGWEFADCEIDYYINSFTVSDGVVFAEVYELINKAFFNRNKEISPAWAGLFHHMYFVINDDLSLTLTDDQYFSPDDPMTDTYEGEGEPYFTSPGLEAFLSEQTAHFVPEIPDTADNSYWVYFAAFLSVGGVFLIISNRRKA
jgi:hypothetical protein